MTGAIEIALWVLLVAALVTDLLWGKIYNALTFPFLFLGLALRFGLEGRAAGLDSLLAVAAAFALYFPFWRLKVIAAGDVKLLMAFGAWTQAMAVIQVGLISIVIGALVGLYLMLRRRGLRDSAQSLVEHVQSRAPRRSFRMPFAPGVLCAFLVFRIAEMRQWNLF